VTDILNRALPNRDRDDKKTNIDPNRQWLSDCRRETFLPAIHEKFSFSFKEIRIFGIFCYEKLVTHFKESCVPKKTGIPPMYAASNHHRQQES